MKPRTIVRIYENYCKGKMTYIGKYVYTVRDGCILMRCKRGFEDTRYIDSEGRQCGCWEEVNNCL